LQGAPTTPQAQWTGFDLWGTHHATASTRSLVMAMMGGRTLMPSPMPTPSPPPSSVVQLGLLTPGSFAWLLTQSPRISPRASAEEVDCCVVHSLCACQGQVLIPARCCRTFLGFHHLPLKLLSPKPLVLLWTAGLPDTVLSDSDS